MTSNDLADWLIRVLRFCFYTTDQNAKEPIERFDRIFPPVDHHLIAPKFQKFPQGTGCDQTIKGRSLITPLPIEAISGNQLSAIIEKLPANLKQGAMVSDDSINPSKEA